MPRLIPNPFSRETVTDPVKGRGYYVDPRYLEFQCLKTNAKREEYLKRHQMGLTPMPEKTPALSKLYPTKASHAMDPARFARYLSSADGKDIVGRIPVEVAYRGMMDESLKPEVRQGWWDRFWRAMRIPDARAVDEKGQPENPEVTVNVLNAIAADPATLAAALTVQRALEAGARVGGGQVVAGSVVARPAPGLPERQDSRDVAEATAPDSQDAAAPRQKRDR